MSSSINISFNFSPVGHQKIATTQIYGEVDKKTIASDIKKVLRKARKSKGSNDLQN